MRKILFLMFATAFAWPVSAQDGQPPAVFPPSGQMQLSTATAAQQEISTAPAAGQFSSVAPWETAAGTAAYGGGGFASNPDAPSRAAPDPKLEKEPFSISGMVLMPNAYRAPALNTLGVNLDINAAYYIGRLYGKNSYDWSLNKVNYIDRLGLWVLTADAKMVAQTEDGIRPALAAGVMGTYTLRDSPQPSLNTTVTVNVSNTSMLSGAYLVASKRFLNKKFLASLGYMEGTQNNLLSYLSEFLTPQALALSGHPGQSATSRGSCFGGLMWFPRPDRPVGFEFIIPQGAPMNPKLVNLHLGTLLHLNFEVSYLSYDGGWDLLGMFQFRYNYYPRGKS
ncbi:MAG: hypothetical protein WC421_03105 [Elusimicrobiales bacterium]